MAATWPVSKNVMSPTGEASMRRSSTVSASNASNLGYGAPAGQGGEHRHRGVQPHLRGTASAYLENGGTLENACHMAAHAPTRTTQLYDRHFPGTEASAGLQSSHTQRRRWSRSRTYSHPPATRITELEAPRTAARTLGLGGRWLRSIPARLPTSFA